MINMCGEYRGPLEDYRRLGIEQLWLPTVVRSVFITRPSPLSLDCVLKSTRPRPNLSIPYRLSQERAREGPIAGGNGSLESGDFLPGHLAGYK